MSGQGFKSLYFWLAVFGIAMGFLEASVVVYLRELYYPFGFGFPLAPIPPFILYTEMLREVTTLAMLLALAMAAGKDFHQRFAFFFFTFGVWDIFYYVGLKALLGWPPSLLTWDILFLIPVAWLGPVLAPVICSLTMIALSIIIAVLRTKFGIVRFGSAGRSLLLAGCLPVLLAFMWDYSVLIVEGGFLGDYFNLPTNERFYEAVSGFIPSEFNWLLFGMGECLFVLAVFLIITNTRKAASVQ